MGPRLILSNAQKSAGAHSPSSADEIWVTHPIEGWASMCGEVKIDDYRLLCFAASMLI